MCNDEVKEIAVIGAGNYKTNEWRKTCGKIMNMRKRGRPRGVWKEVMEDLIVKEGHFLILQYPNASYIFVWKRKGLRGISWKKTKDSWNRTTNN